jgi:hypothetical protein
MIRSSRLAEPQSAVALDNAEPRICDFIAGTLIEVIAAARESTATAFCDLVFCRIVIITASSVNVTADALTICARSTHIWSVMSANVQAGRVCARRDRPRDNISESTRAA